MMKIAIAIPTAGMVPWAFSYSLVNLISYMWAHADDLNVGVGVRSAEGSNWIENRENLVQRAIGEGFTHICFIDDDMVFAPDVLARLIRHGKDIVVTNYVVKEWPPTTFTARGLDGERVRTSEASTGLQEVLGSGFGFSLINLDVFKALQQPWFLPMWNEQTKEYSTEDFPFFARARAAGYPVWLDHDASRGLTHLGRKQWHWREVE